MPTGPKMPDNVLLNKAAIIERSLKRMGEDYQQNPALDNYTHIDAMVLNIERACQAAIDAAQHIIARDHLGVPQTSAEAFDLLYKNKILGPSTSKAMIGMTGFRNVAVHEYQALDMEIVRTIATKKYRSLINFCKEIGIKIEPGFDAAPGEIEKE